MAEDTDRLYQTCIRFRRDLRLAAQPGVISYGNRRKSNTHTKSRQRVSFTTDLSEQSKESSRLLLREKGDRADFHGVEYRVVDEELLCVKDTSSVICFADATFPYWGRQ